MKRAARAVARWIAGLLVATVAALTGIGMPAVAGAVLVVGIIVGAMCWTISDSGRSDRLALLIGSARGSAQQRTQQGDRAALPASSGGPGASS